MKGHLRPWEYIIKINMILKRETQGGRSLIYIFDKCVFLNDSLISLHCMRSQVHFRDKSNVFNKDSTWQCKLSMRLRPTCYD